MYLWYMFGSMLVYHPTLYTEGAGKYQPANQQDGINRLASSMHLQSFGSRLPFNVSDAMAMDEVLLRLFVKKRHVTEETDSTHVNVVLDVCFQGFFTDGLLKSGHYTWVAVAWWSRGRDWRRILLEAPSLFETHYNLQARHEGFHAIFGRFAWFFLWELLPLIFPKWQVFLVQDWKFRQLLEAPILGPGWSDHWDPPGWQNGLAFARLSTRIRWSPNPFGSSTSGFVCSDSIWFWDFYEEADKGCMDMGPALWLVWFVILGHRGFEESPWECPQRNARGDQTVARNW